MDQDQDQDGDQNQHQDQDQDQALLLSSASLLTRWFYAIIEPWRSSLQASMA